MPRVIPSPTQYRYGGMIQGKDYEAVLKVLDDIAEIIGVEEKAPILITDLVDGLVGYIEYDREISYESGREDGCEDDHAGVNVVRQEGVDQCTATHGSLEDAAFERGQASARAEVAVALAALGGRIVELEGELAAKPVEPKVRTKS